MIVHKGRVTVAPGRTCPEAFLGLQRSHCPLNGSGVFRPASVSGSGNDFRCCGAAG